MNFTHTWTYDNAGNIQSRVEYAYTTAVELENVTPTNTILYGYTDSSGWGDLLTSYDGKTVSYDNIGNPLTDGEWTYTWQNGRQLASMSNGNRTWTFTYDANGMRTSRSPGYEQCTYTYTYNGSKLTQMEVEGSTFRFSYDASGTPVSFTMNNSLFFYETNLQGDVVGIWDQNGNRLVHYAYDAWGNVQILQNHQIAEFNPLLYRGYVYDFETGLYYIHSRYYNPEVGRFLNSDIIASTGQGILGNNMFAYCGNNPVARTDIGGYFWDIVFDVVSLVVSIVEVVNDPEDVSAWVGLALDVVDVVIPFVGGLGEAADAVSTAVKITDAVDDANDTYKAVDNSLDLAEGMHNAQRATNMPTEGLCFIAGTLVKTASGTKAIEEIKAGDVVWAWDEETNTVALKCVVETYINETTELVHLYVNGEEIVSTPSHPFYSPVKGWTDAVHLRAGDILMTVNGEFVVIEKIQHEILESPIKVYNFHVEEYHTYYVSNVSILVHNSCYNPRRTPDQQALADLSHEIERNARQGHFISYDEARYLDELALEYGVPQHHQAMIGSWVHWKTGWNHTHIYNIHVPFK